MGPIRAALLPLAGLSCGRANLTSSLIVGCAGTCIHPDLRSTEDRLTRQRHRPAIQPSFVILIRVAGEEDIAAESFWDPLRSPIERLATIESGRCQSNIRDQLTEGRPHSTTIWIDLSSEPVNKSPPSVIDAEAKASALPPWKGPSGDATLTETV